jgi:hypothetical protein
VGNGENEHTRSPKEGALEVLRTSDSKKKKLLDGLSFELCG